MIHASQIDIKKQLQLHNNTKISQKESFSLLDLGVGKSWKVDTFMPFSFFRHTLAQ